MEKSFITNTIGETQEAGENLAKEILKTEGPVVIGLIGDLGSAKTTFLQGFAKGLGIKEKILSPTFVVLKHFKITNSKFEIRNSKFTDFYHIDCYRLQNSKDILELGWQEILKDSKNIIAVEWPEKIKDVLPKNTLFIKFNFIDEQKREIIFE